MLVEDSKGLVLDVGQQPIHDMVNGALEGERHCGILEHAARVLRARVERHLDLLLYTVSEGGTRDHPSRLKPLPPVEGEPTFESAELAEAAPQREYNRGEREERERQYGRAAPPPAGSRYCRLHSRTGKLSHAHTPHSQLSKRLKREGVRGGRSCA